GTRGLHSPPPFRQDRRIRPSRAQSASARTLRRTRQPPGSDQSRESRIPIWYAIGRNRRRRKRQAPARRRHSSGSAAECQKGADQDAVYAPPRKSGASEGSDHLVL